MKHNIGRQLLALLIYVLVVIVGVWIIFTFITWNINPYEWTMTHRALASAAAVAGSMPGLKSLTDE